ncbi:BA14K family protein [Devosia aurantiaca]|uniref:Lectin-like protein BA14k n=1 Tax=Devosia aurantiaca TaxID=2714858 RepID=A0A6M1T2N3_9HYPH|nr:BA14K family protein [Devosia aurantiaca]
MGPARGSNVNVAACQARYRSYDVRTNTFLGYDGVRHPCNL